jgi:hypothetical protein
MISSFVPTVIPSLETDLLFMACVGKNALAYVFGYITAEVISVFVSHFTEKSEAVAQIGGGPEHTMLVIPVNKVVEEKIMIGKMGLSWGRSRVARFFLVQQTKMGK